MGHFYLLSEVLTPVMAWGFLGTDQHLKQQCHQLKVCIFISTIVQYASPPVALPHILSRAPLHIFYRPSFPWSLSATLL